MQKIVRAILILISTLVGAAFLNGAGVSYENWYAMPVNISKMVVTIATLAAFVKIAIFLSSKLCKKLKSCKEV